MSALEFPTLKELKASKTAPLQSFSKMKDTKIKTMRTVKAIARHQGKRLIISNVESFGHHKGLVHKKDMFGIFDALAIESEHNRSLILDAGMEAYYSSFKGAKFRGLQACGTDWQSHIEKLRENVETCALWLAPGNSTIELWGWRRVKRNGHRVFRPRMQLITLEFLLGKEKADVIELFKD